MAREATSAAEAVARRSYGKLVAFLATRMGDVEAAEDALSEAFAAALTDWDTGGVPDNPEGWLVTVARRPPSMRHGGGAAARPRSPISSSWPRNSQRNWRTQRATR
jgi:RNA polymerase sigma-70 factor (ECF subfamily)